MAEKEKDQKAPSKDRVARTRLKYGGVWYAPGEPVPLKSAKDAEPYDKAGALERK